MKKISSNSSHSSSSAPSSSTSRFDPPSAMCNNSKNGSSGCFNAILRRILCSGGLPTHPSDQIREFDPNPILGSAKDQNFNPKKHHAKATTSSSVSSSVTTTTTTTTTTPGIVARLMGLDSMVEMPSNSSLSRSKSMNSVDCLGEGNRMDGLHKRVKSTLSFRELPTFLLLENENFFVLSFENKKKNHNNGEELKEKKRENVKSSSKRVADANLQEITNTCYYERNKKNKKKKNMCFDSEARKLSQPRILKDDAVVVGGGDERMKRRRRRKRNNNNSNCFTEKKKSQVESNKPSSEDTSPVSVLDFEKREACEPANLNSRRKLSPELENDQKILVRSDGDLMDEEGKTNKLCEEGSKKKEKNVKIWDEICKLAKEDEVAWMNNNKKQVGDLLGSISADFASHIFDQLLNEVVIDQLLVEDP
ncbi:hypothetical protein PIB30_089891 [Stylosanthes scabra]|uniref:DUF3741 domain-containing protein n=1 Tax=Stylosanthes scabra TaxID=79078 RepID=A0ABU6QUV4_9FABA|nr:hypothetical protein [Stylosanthes scabra]